MVGQKKLGATELNGNWRELAPFEQFPLGAVRCQCLWEKIDNTDKCLYIYRRIRFVILKFCRFWSNKYRKCFHVLHRSFHRFASSLITYITCYRVRAIVTVPSGKAVQWHAKPAACFSTTSETIPRSCSRKNITFQSNITPIFKFWDCRVSMLLW